MESVHRWCIHLLHSSTRNFNHWIHNLRTCFLVHHLDLLDCFVSVFLSLSFSLLRRAKNVNRPGKVRLRYRNMRRIFPFWEASGHHHHHSSLSIIYLLHHTLVGQWYSMLCNATLFTGTCSASSFVYSPRLLLKLEVGRESSIARAAFYDRLSSPHTLEPISQLDCTLMLFFLFSTAPLQPILP